MWLRALRKHWPVLGAAGGVLSQGLIVPARPYPTYCVGTPPSSPKASLDVQIAKPLSKVDLFFSSIKGQQPAPSATPSAPSAPAESAELPAPTTPAATLKAKPILGKTPSNPFSPKKRRWGRQSGHADHTFADRMAAYAYLEEIGYIVQHEHHYIGNKDALPPGDRKVAIPVLPGNPSVRFDLVLGWKRSSRDEDWDGMIADPALAKDLGEQWWKTKGRIPTYWRKTLNERRAATGDARVLPTVGRVPHIQKHPELLQCIVEADALHQDVRAGKRRADLDGFHASLRSVVGLRNATLKDADLATIEGPHLKMSRWWVQQRVSELDAKRQSVSSIEPKSVEPEDLERYWREYKEKMEEVGDVRLQQTFDEFNGFNDRPPRNVLTHRSEPENRKGHVARLGGGRKTWTGGVVFGPLHKGKALYLAKAIPAATLALIARDFGKVLLIKSNATGNVHGQFHVETILPGLQAHAAQRARNLFGKGCDALVLQKEDFAPGHVGDEDTVTKATGLKERRKIFHQENHIRRHLFPRNGTPDVCENDQIHAVLELLIDQKIRELSAQCKDWTKLPAKELMGRAGNFVTAKGYVRGPTHYIIAMAISTVWAAFPQTHCMASFIRTGAISKEMAAKLLEKSSSDMDLIMSEFEVQQNRVKKQNRWAHPDQSGIDKGAACPQKALLDLDWAWLEDSTASPAAGPAAEAQQAEVSEINAGIKQVQAAKQKTLVEHIKAVGQFEEQAVADEITGKDVKPFRGALGNLENTPGPNNASNLPAFKVCLTSLLKDTATWSRHRADAIDSIFEWQLWLLTNDWKERRINQDPTVTKTTLDMFVWKTLKKLQTMKHIGDRDKVFMSMVGDYKRLSLNPRAATFLPQTPAAKAKARAEKKAKAKAKAHAKAAAIAAAIIAD